MSAPSFLWTDVIGIKTLKIVIDNATVNKYNDYYFMRYPNRKKAPILSPIHPSLNKWTGMMREAKNALKQHWDDFTVWFIEDKGLSNLGIEKCKIKVINYFKDNRVRDLDNVTIKFFQDGFVRSGLIVKDDFKHIEELTLCGKVDGHHCRTEFYITYDYEYEELEGIIDKLCDE